MAQTTTNYALLKPESTDNYNHLIYDNPNMDTIDSVMKTNSNTGITPATCVKSGTVHTITRTNTSCPVFRFTATGDWNAGDTMIIDGVTVSVFLPNGAAASNNCYIINSEVIASVVGTRVTILSNAADATTIGYDDSSVTFTASNVQQAVDALNDAANVEYIAGVSVKDELDELTGNITLSAFVDISGYSTASGLKYVAPKDGYLNVINTLAQGRNVNVGIEPNVAYMAATPNGGTLILYIKKGMEIQSNLLNTSEQSSYIMRFFAIN